jgi:hypothetical protein
VRATYSPQNANDWKGLFDEMERNKHDMFVSSEDTLLKPNTLYIKLNDALKWLSENDSEKDKYAILRTRVVIGRKSNGVAITFKRVIANIVARSMQNWADDFDKWFETAQEGDTFERQNILVSDTQRQHVIGLMSGVGVTAEVEITTSSVRVMR